MLKSLRSIALLALLIPSFQSHAADQTSSDHTDERMATESISPWEFGLAVGVGERSNPLYFAADIDLDVIFHLAYFGERFFFDNGDLGYALAMADTWTLNLVAGINTERQFFNLINRVGLFGVGVGGERINEPDVIGGADDINAEDDLVVEITPPDRAAPVDSGFELLIDGSWGHFQLQWLTDIGSQHDGQEIFLSYAYPLQIGDLKVVSSFGAIYKNTKWTDYFYGVSETEVITSPDNVIVRDAYQASEAYNHFFKINVQYLITEHWRFVALFEREYLHDEITSSPIIDDSRIETSYIGLYYQF